MEVYVAIQTGDAGEELLGVFASLDGAVGAMKSRSYRGSEATNVEPFRTWSGRDGWYLTNPHQIDQPLARQWVGVVHKAPLEGVAHRDAVGPLRTWAESYVREVQAMYAEQESA